MKIKTILTLSAICHLLVLQAQEIDYKGLPQWSWQKRDSTEYFLYTPSNIKKDKRYPVVLALHGCCGKDYKATLRNTVDPIVRVWHNFGENTQDEPTYIIAPRTSRGWMQHADNLKAAIDDLIRDRQADPQRIYITGFSMGADGGWKFLEKYPNFFAAAVLMGANYGGKDPEKVRHIPVWAIRGGKDWWARYLGKQVADLRQRNNLPADSSAGHTGVNPRFTSFEELGHVVMWEAAKSLEIRKWTYSKINDGNRYPFVYFKGEFKSDTLRAKPGAMLSLHVEAFDEDGAIANVWFYQNDQLIEKITAPPYSVEWKVQSGITTIKAVAQDDKGKTSEARLVVSADEFVSFKNTTLPTGAVARYYKHSISPTGNKPISHTVVSGQLPEGISLSSDGVLTGFAGKEGTYSFIVNATDRDGEQAQQRFKITITKKSRGDVLVSDVVDYQNKPLTIAPLKKGSMPFYDRNDGEINISSLPRKFEGLTFIQTAFNDTTKASPHYLSFRVDAPVTVYIFYEKKDNLFSSTVPAWLSSFRKSGPEQLVVQYFYYDVYEKDFPAGVITLPDAEEKANGVSTNYFVAVKAR